jgi:hypothetical protein
VARGPSSVLAIDARLEVNGQHNVSKVPCVSPVDTFAQAYLTMTALGTCMLLRFEFLKAQNAYRS